MIGSGTMSAHGIRNHQDIDLLVTDDLYSKLKDAGWEIQWPRPDFEYLKKGTAGASPKMVALSNYSPSLSTLISTADIINGIPFMSLEDLIQFKRALGRDKDIKDIVLIEKYIAGL